MEPTDALRNLLHALHSGYREIAQDACDDLAKWLKSDDYSPTSVDVDAASNDFKADVLVTPRRSRAAFFGPAPSPHADVTAGPTPLAKPNPGFPFKPVTKPPGTLPHR